jgi:hypothetical protein
MKMAAAEKVKWKLCYVVGLNIKSFVHLKFLFLVVLSDWHFRTMRSLDDEMLLNVRMFIVLLKYYFGESDLSLMAI